MSFNTDFSEVFTAERNPKIEFVNEKVKWNMSNATNMEKILRMRALQAGKRIEIEWNVSNVTNMDQMFQGNKQIKGSELKRWERCVPCLR